MRDVRHHFSSVCRWLGVDGMGQGWRLCSSVQRWASAPIWLLRQSRCAGLHWPLAAQLYLPAEWTDDPGRMTKAGVPAHAQAFREKWCIALALLDEMKPQLPAYQAIVFDAGYGVVQPLLAELDKRQEPYVAQVPGNIAAWPAEAVATLTPARRGRPRQHAIVRDPAMHPLSMMGWRDKLLREPKRWAQVPLPRADGASVRTAAVRVQASQRASRRRQPGEARWLLIEQLGEDITIKGTRGRPLRGPFLAGAAPSSHAVLPRVLFPDQTAVAKKNAPRCLKSPAGSWRRWPFAPVRTVRPASLAPGSSLAWKPTASRSPIILLAMRLLASTNIISIPCSASNRTGDCEPDGRENHAVIFDKNIIVSVIQDRHPRRYH